MKKPREEFNNKFFDNIMNSDEYLHVSIDPVKNQIRRYSKDMLEKRIRRESIHVAKSFDKLCGEEFCEIDELFSLANVYIGEGLFLASNEENDMKITSGMLLMNAAETIQASIELLRRGYLLQPGMLLRSIIETISTVAYFMSEPSGHKIYLEGKMDVNKIMKYGKQVIPNLGIIQGILSNFFVHISNLHSDFNGVDSYDEYSESLKINISLIKSCTWSLYIVSELTFFDYFDDHTYWTKVSDNQYKFEENEQVRQWKTKFFKEQYNSF